VGLRLSRLRVFVPKDAASSGAITVVPGQARALVSLRNDIPGGSVVRILVMGATQHPASTYSYEADGKGFSIPFPLGTLINPLYTCLHFGSFVEFQDSFSIAVQNNDTKPHRYAALVITEPTVSTR